MTLKNIALSSAVVALFAAQAVSAHTGIKDKVFIEGQGNTGPSLSIASDGKVTLGNSATAYNAFTTTHGCASNAFPEGTTGVTRKDVIAQASLFPNSTNAADVKIYRYKTGSIAANVVGVDGTVLTGQASTLTVASPTDLTDDINGAVAGAGLSNLGLGLVSPNLFGNWIVPKLDSTGLNARGYAVFNGPGSAPLSESVISTTGLSAFKFNVPTFKSTSCAMNLVVRVAVSNWCSRGEAGKYAPDRKDVWIGTDTGSVLYSMRGMDAGIMPNGQSVMGMGGSTGVAVTEQGNGKSFWPSFTVTRNLTTNPLPAACNGQSYDVVVQPSGADIDKNLTINQGAYPNGAPGAKFY